MAGLDTVYKDVDGFFEQNGMHDLPCPGRVNNTAMARVSKGVFVEFGDCYALPFDVRQTTKVIWTLKKDHSAEENLFFLQNFTAGSNTQMRSMCFAFNLEGVDFRVVTRCVTRKYVEKGRTVFIFRTLIQPNYDGMSITLVETTRMVLKRGDLSTLGPTTVMQTHREATLHGEVPVVETDKYPSMDVGLENWENNITHYNNRLEDQLIRATS